MICSEVDELSVMTYVVLIFEYDLERTSTSSLKNSTNQNSSSNNSTNHGSSFYNDNIENIAEKKREKGNTVTGNIDSENNKENVKRKPEIGKVGKEIECRLNLHDVNANEIIFSVEFKPAEKLTQDYKPDLRVFSMGKGRFRVKYTPNLAGNYRLSMYYKDEHIADSPYCVQVLPKFERENARIELNNNTGKSRGKSERNLFLSQSRA